MKLVSRIILHATKNLVLTHVRRSRTIGIRVMSNNDLEKQIQELNTKIAELALIVSLKTKEMDTIEQRYSDRIRILNEYLATVRAGLNIESQEGHIDDTTFIDKLRSMSHNDDIKDYVLVPTKPLQMNSIKNPKNETKTKTESEVAQNTQHKKAYNIAVNEPTYNRKKKISCSYCNEKGHKRSQCPKILYHEA